MKNVKRKLTDKEMDDLCFVSSKKILKKFKSIITDELDKVFKNNEEINVNDFICVTIHSLILLDINVILSIMDVNSSTIGRKVDFNIISSLYFKNLAHTFEEKLQKIKNDGMN